MIERFKILVDGSGTSFVIRHVVYGDSPKSGSMFNLYLNVRPILS